MSATSHALHLFFVIYVSPVFCSILPPHFQLIYGSNVERDKGYVSHHHHLWKKRLSCVKILPDTVCGLSATVTMLICQLEYRNGTESLCT